MDKYSPESRVITLTSARVAGWCGLPRPPAWTSVVQAAFVRFPEVDMFLVLQAKLDLSGEGSSCF